VGEVLAHGSSRVPHATYEALLDASPLLLPAGVQGVFWADRGFADTPLLAHGRRLQGHFRIRITATFGVTRAGQLPGKVEDFSLAAGRALVLHHVAMTAEQFGPVSRALGCQTNTGECGDGVSDEPPRGQTWVEDGWRFASEENFLDDKSPGFQLESALVRDSQPLPRLCGVFALTTRSLGAPGTQVGQSNKRRGGDPHWFRGTSSLRIGWQWGKAALARGGALLATLHLSGAPDPAPSRAAASPSRLSLPVIFTRTFCYAPS
jgi:hypothetical protein